MYVVSAILQMKKVRLTLNNLLKVKKTHNRWSQDLLPGLTLKSCSVLSSANNFRGLKSIFFSEPRWWKNRLFYSIASYDCGFQNFFFNLWSCEATSDSARTLSSSKIASWATNLFASGPTFSAFPPSTIENNSSHLCSTSLLCCFLKVFHHFFL